MWFIFSLCSIVAWGGSDLFSKMGTNPKDKYSHWRVVIVVGLVMGLHATLYILITGFAYTPFSIIKYLPVSLMYILSMTFGYAGLRYIQLSVSSPICNSSGAVTALLVFFVLGQTMTHIQFLAVVVICLGILLLSYFEKMEDDAERKLRGEKADPKLTVGVIAILFPIIYCILDGMGSFLDAFYLEHIMSEAEANLSYEYTFLICACLVWCYLVLIRKQKFNILREKTFCVGAFCETAGQFTYVYAMSENAIVAAPMIASYSIFSVLLSRIFLKEKLSLKQYLAIALVMVGIAILGMD